MTAPKLSDLTEQDKLRLAAELDGWKHFEGEDADTWWNYWERGNIRIPDSQWNPRYSTSYDAIIPLVQELGMFTVLYEADWLNLASPSQLLDALLVTTGKATI